MWNSKKYPCCRGCGTKKRRHMAQGYCNPCYQRLYRNDPANRDRVANSKRDWYQRNRPAQLLQRKQTRERTHFDNKREDVLKRDNYQCTRCGSGKKLTVHHKDRRGRGRKRPNNSMANLETVCRACHLEEHRGELVAAKRKKHCEPILGKTGRWSRKYDCCVRCGHTWARHASRGVCGTCYQQK